MQEQALEALLPELNERIARFDSPFRRLDEWLAGIAPNAQLPPINMSVGEPQDAPPSLLTEAVAANAHLWNRYPQAVGTPEFRRAATGYLERRYPATRGRIDPDAQISPVTSSREGLYLAAAIATSPVAFVLVPCETHFLVVAFHSQTF